MFKGLESISSILWSGTEKNLCPRPTPGKGGCAVVGGPIVWLCLPFIESHLSAIIALKIMCGVSKMVSHPAPNPLRLSKTFTSLDPLSAAQAQYKNTSGVHILVTSKDPSTPSPTCVPHFLPSPPTESFMPAASRLHRFCEEQNSLHTF